MFIRGMVVRGKGEGRKLGYPTANLEYQVLTHPEPGVYAARVLLDGKIARGAAIVGMWRLENGCPSVEVHLLEHVGDLYGRELQVVLYEKIRGLQSFPHQEALIACIEKDISEIQRRLEVK